MELQMKHYETKLAAIRAKRSKEKQLPELPEITLKIESIIVKKSAIEVSIYFSDGQWMKVFKFGSTFYTTVSELVNKNAVREIAVFISGSDYFRAKKVTIENSNKLEEQLKSYIGKEYKTF